MADLSSNFINRLEISGVNMTTHAESADHSHVYTEWSILKPVIKSDEHGSLQQSFRNCRQKKPDWSHPQNRQSHSERSASNQHCQLPGDELWTTIGGLYESNTVVLILPLNMSFKSYTRTTFSPQSSTHGRFSGEMPKFERHLAAWDLQQH